MRTSGHSFVTRASMYWLGMGVSPHVVQPVVVPLTINNLPHCTT